MQGKSWKPKILHMAWKTLLLKDCFSFLTERSCKLSLFLFGKEDWTTVKKTPVLEPVYWLAWRNNSHTREKGGIYFISFPYFCSLYATQPLISGPPSHSDTFPSVWPGPGVKGADAWGCTSLLPQRGVSWAEKLWTGERALEGKYFKYFLMGSCVSQGGGMTWPGRLEAQSFIGTSGEGANQGAVSWDSVTWVLCCRCPSPARPACQRQLCWLPFPFASKS